MKVTSSFSWRSTRSNSELSL